MLYTRRTLAAWGCERFSYYSILRPLKPRSRSKWSTSNPKSTEPEALWIKARVGACLENRSGTGWGAGLGPPLAIALASLKADRLAILTVVRPGNVDSIRLSINQLCAAASKRRRVRSNAMATGY